MSERADEYEIECIHGAAILRGALRLEGPASYERVFEPIERELARAPAFTLDLRPLAFLNSSGIRAIALLVLSAKTHGKAIAVLGDESVPWQKKTFPSLRALHPALDVRFG